MGEFQEIVLLSILILNDEAYGVRIQETIAQRTGRGISRGALHSALSRLEGKGFIGSKMAGATKERGGRRKRYYSITNSGKIALRDVRSLRENLWKEVPELIIAK